MFDYSTEIPLMSATKSFQAHFNHQMKIIVQILMYTGRVRVIEINQEIH